MTPSSSHTRARACVPGGFRYVPETLDLMSRDVLMAVSCEYDVMGRPLAHTRRQHEAALSSDAFSAALEPRRRDRLVCYVLAHLLGDYLAPLVHPDQQRASAVLSLPLSYPQFVEVVGACVVLRHAAQQLDGGRLLRSPRTAWGAAALAGGASWLSDGLAVWRERVLSPWRFGRVHFSDCELDEVIDRVFSRFCCIDPARAAVRISSYNFQRMLEVWGHARAHA
eukprot:350630-Chlamydomonas_euryale.AAC.2